MKKEYIDDLSPSMSCHSVTCHIGEFLLYLVDFRGVVAFDELSFNEVSGTDQYVYEIPVSLQNTSLINSYFLSP